MQQFEARNNTSTTTSTDNLIVDENVAALISDVIIAGPHNSTAHAVIPQDIFASFDAWKEKAKELARKITTSEFPSGKNPFAFLHQRKAGGSSLRQLVYDAAHDKLGLNKNTLWIPCHTVICADFDTPPRAVRAVYASHVNYIDVVKSIREDNPNRGNIEKFQEKGVLKNGDQTVFYHIDEDNHLFDCMTNLRSTVSRVVSCWNFRMIQTAMPAWKTSPANELSSEDWETILPQAYDKYNNGCNNEVARIFGSLHDESAINTLSPDDPIFLHEFNKIASRMSRCVVLIPERCEDSNKVISHYFPWMGEVADLCHSHLNSAKGHAKSSKDLQDGAADAILSQNVMDELLFQFGLSLFDEQVRIANEAKENVTLV